MQLKAEPAPWPSVKSQAHPSFPSIPSFQPVRPTGALALTNPTPQPNPYFTFWLQTLRSLGVQRNPNRPQRYRSDPAERELPFQALGVASAARGPGRSVFPGEGGTWPPARRAHMASSAPLERSPCSSKRRRTLLLSASARRYGWFRRSAGSRQSAAPARGHADTRHGRTDTERPAGSQSKQLVEDGSRDRPRRRAGKDGRARATRPSGRLILVGSGCWWDWCCGNGPSHPSPRPRRPQPDGLRCSCVFPRARAAVCSSRQLCDPTGMDLGSPRPI